MNGDDKTVFFSISVMYLLSSTQGHFEENVLMTIDHVRSMSSDSCERGLLLLGIVLDLHRRPYRLRLVHGRGETRTRGPVESHGTFDQIPSDLITTRDNRRK